MELLAAIVGGGLSAFVAVGVVVIIPRKFTYWRRSRTVRNGILVE